MGLFSCEVDFIDKLKTISKKSSVESFTKKLFSTTDRLNASIFAQGAGLTASLKMFSDNSTVQQLENYCKIDDVEFSATTRQHITTNVTHFGERQL